MRCWFVSGLLVSLLGSASAQEVRLLDCPSVAFFAEPCVQVEAVLDSQAPVVPPEPYPLFTPAEMAPDTPAIALRAFRDPTDANILAWLQWQAERQERITYVQHRVRVLAPQVQAGGR